MNHLRALDGIDQLADSRTALIDKFNGPFSGRGLSIFGTSVDIDGRVCVGFCG